MCFGYRNLGDDAAAVTRVFANDDQMLTSEFNCYSRLYHPPNELLRDLSERAHLYL